MKSETVVLDSGFTPSQVGFIRLAHIQFGSRVDPTSARPGMTEQGLARNSLTSSPIETIFLFAISVEGVLEAQTERGMAGVSVCVSQSQAGTTRGSARRD